MAKKNNARRNADKIRMDNIKKRAASSKSAARKNPFEIKVNKEKHQILNRKRKHHMGIPGVSRSAAKKKRQDTLQVELDQLNHASVLQDNRIGAGNSEMSPEEKMLKQLAFDRKNQSSNENFNMDTTVQLTHMGQTLSDMNFKRPGFGFSDDESEAGDTADNFGGGVFTKKDESVPHTETTKEALIKKSIETKHEKKKNKAECEDIMHQLNTQFKQSQREMCMSKEEHDDEKEKYLRDPNEAKYNMHVNQLKMSQKRVAACKQTREQKALEDAKKKNKYIEEKLRRMRGEKSEVKIKQPNRQVQLDSRCDVYNMDPIEEKDDFVLKFSINPENDVESRGGDDYDEELDGNLVIPDSDNNSGDEEKEEENNSDENSGSRDHGIVDDESVVSEDESSDESDEENFSDIDSGNEEADEEAMSNTGFALDYEEDDDEDKTVLSSSKLGNFPKTFNEFLSLISPQKSAINVALQLSKKHAANLGPGNKEKLVVLFDHMWEYCIKISGPNTVQMKVLDSFIAVLYKMLAANPEACSKRVTEHLVKSYNVCLPPRVNENSSYSPPWPSMHHIMPFKMIKQLFPTSDYSHPVTSPALIFMSRLLQNCQIASVRDIKTGLTVSTFLYEYICFSKRFIPEVLNFLACALASALPKSVIVKPDMQKAVSTRKFTRRSCMLLVPQDYAVSSDQLLTLSHQVDEEETTDELKYECLRTTVKLVLMFTELYKEMPCYDIIFRAHSTISSELLAHASYGGDLKQLLTELVEKVNSKQMTYKRMSFGPRKPAMLKMFEPKLYEFTGDPFSKRSKNMTSDRRETERLRAKMKDERKGAMREIRKDSRFVAEYRQQKQAEHDTHRTDIAKAIKGDLANQEGAYKQICRKKIRLGL